MKARIAGAITLLAMFCLAIAPTARATPLHSFLSTRGTSIVDSSGNAVLLRGVNYPGYETDEIARHSWYEYVRFAQSGFNVVRLPISWAALEPEPGYINTAYLSDYVDQDVQWATSLGLYIIIDMHQFNWAGKFGGYGAPFWAVQKYPANELGLRQAVSDFWAEPSLQSHLLTVWAKIAQRYANDPTVAGYDILNEPWVYTSIIPTLNSTNVDAFYLRVMTAIREVDQNHMIFLEPANFPSTQLRSVPNIVWSPHFYPLSFDTKYYPENSSVLEADLQAKYQKYVVEAGNPMWVGEFGAFMQDSSAYKWLETAKVLFDRYQLGWAWWSFQLGAWASIPNCLTNPATSPSAITVTEVSDNILAGKI